MGKGQDFSAVINGIQHFVSDASQLVQQATSELSTLGLAPFGEMGAFIHSPASA